MNLFWSKVMKNSLKNHIWKRSYISKILILTIQKMDEKSQKRWFLFICKYFFKNEICIKYGIYQTFYKNKLWEPAVLCIFWLVTFAKTSGVWCKWQKTLFFSLFLKGKKQKIWFSALIMCSRTYWTPLIRNHPTNENYFLRLHFRKLPNNLKIRFLPCCEWIRAFTTAKSRIYVRFDFDWKIR